MQKLDRRESSKFGDFVLREKLAQIVDLDGEFLRSL
jgi:hypothetical protein